MKKAMRIAVVVCVVALAATLCGCSASQSANNTSSQNNTSDETKSSAGIVEFDGGWLLYDDNNVIVTLSENATTGYEWTAAVEGTNLALQEEEVVAAQEASSDNAVGTPGTHVYYYQGTQAGEGTLTFTYARNWEQTDDDRVVTIKVTTNDGGLISSAQIS